MPLWETTSDWDAFQDETGVHHEQPASTSWAASDTIEAGYPTYDPNGTSLEAYWPFDDISGGTLADVSGNGHDATTVNAMSSTTGAFNNDAGDFDGSTSYIQHPTGVLSTGSDFTLECWINPDDQNEMRILHPREDVNFFVALNDSGTTTGTPKTVDIYVSTGYVADTANVNINEWQYLAVRYDDSAPTVETTVNTTHSGAFAPASTTSTSSGSGNWIGVDRDAASEFYNGQLCEVRYFSRLRSDQEIEDAYNAAI